MTRIWKIFKLDSCLLYHYYKFKFHHCTNYKGMDLYRLHIAWALFFQYPWYEHQILETTETSKWHPHSEPPSKEIHHISIAHLNTQSIMLSRNQFDIITLSEIWLKDHDWLVNLVTIPGYNFQYYNRTEKRGVCIVGICIKVSMKYSARKGISNIDRTVVHLWTEVNGKNKCNSFLIALFYQPSWIEKEKEARLEKFDISALASAKWNGQMIVPSDFNISNFHQSQITEKYSEVLKHHDLIEHIEKPTRSKLTEVNWPQIFKSNKSSFTKCTNMRRNQRSRCTLYY